MFIKTYSSLFVIGVVVALSYGVHGNVDPPVGIPQKIIVQLHYVVKLMRKWVDFNRNVNSEDFKSHFNQLGSHVTRILSRIPPGHGDFCLWQLNILAHQIQPYYKVRYDNEGHSGGPVNNWISESLFQFLCMVEARLKSMVGATQSLRKSAFAFRTNGSRLLKTVIPDELNTLDRYIRNSKELNSTAANSSGGGSGGQNDSSSYHPRHLYLNHIVSTASHVLVSNSLLKKWNTQKFHQELANEYNGAIYECGNTDRDYSRLTSLRHFVYVKTILVSVIGHLDVHFNAYRLHAQHTGDAGREDLWNSVVVMLGGFIKFYRPEYNNYAVCDVYAYLVRARDKRDPGALTEVCGFASHLLQGVFAAVCPVDPDQPSTSSGSRSTEDVLMDAVKNVRTYPQQFMSIAEENYMQLNDYLSNLHTLFEDVDSSKLVHFLNLYLE